MIDLTPLDVRKKRGDFRRLLRGYDPEEVDSFMDLVAERFEELVRENLFLSEKVGSLEGQLGALVGRENAVQEALVTAQKLREEVKDQSKRDAEILQEQANRAAEILKAEADAEISRRLGEAEDLVRERRRALEDLERSRLKFLKSFRGLLERELDAVEVEESRRPLEDAPLELELRGWTFSEFGEEAEEVEDLTEPEEEVVPAEEEREAEEPAPEEPETADFVVEEEPQAHESWEVREEEGDEVEAEVQDAPGGFETQVLERAVPAGLSELPDEDEPEEVATAAASDSHDPFVPRDESLPEPPKEPKWLFSLLKKDEEQDGEG